MKILLPLVLCFALAACKKSEAPKKPEPSPAVAPAPVAPSPAPTAAAAAPTPPAPAPSPTPAVAAPSGKVNGSCTMPFPECWDYVGPGAEQAKKECAAARGAFAASPCKADGRVGSCVQRPGTPMELVFRYYAGPMKPADLQARCAAMPGRQWLPN